MPYLQCRGSIILGAVSVALFWPISAAAQVGPYHGHGGSQNPLVTGAYIEIADHAKAERRLAHLGAKFRGDAARGNAAAMDRDAYRIAKTQFRIGVDEWLIRYNTCQQLSPYPHQICLDPMSREAIAQYRRPSFGP